MSNPNKPTVASTAVALGNALPDAAINWSEEARAAQMRGFGQGTDNPARVVGLFRTHGNPPYAEGRGPGLDLEKAATVMAPARWSSDPRRQIKSELFMWSTTSAPLSLRLRSGHAYAVGNQFFRALPRREDLAGLGLPPAAYERFTREYVSSVSKEKIFATGSTWDCIGRLLKAVPLKGSRVPLPPTRGEARAAVRECGLDLVSNGHVPGALRLADLRVPGRFFINTHSDNGCPVGGKWDTPGAADKCEALALSVWEQLERLKHPTDVTLTRTRVQEHMRHLMVAAPWLCAFTGKCKGDCYSLDKLRDAQMRFYLSGPRQLALIMQTVTKPLGADKRSVLDVGHSAMGISMHRGGAARLIEKMQGMLDDTGVAYVHVGDDTFFAARDPEGGVVMFSLDCSNFDLTQHADATAEVHAALFDQLARIEPVAAALWYSLARERLVTCFGGGTFVFRHCGPSGLQIQSYVNDVLMQVVCARLAARLTPATAHNRAALDALVQEVGSGLALSIRLEDHVVTAFPTLVGALSASPFLFIGYYFYTSPTEGVTVFCDVARTLAQLRYPKGWEKNEQAFRTKEVVRLASIGLNMGCMPEFLRRAFDEYGSTVAGWLTRELDHGVDLDAGTMHWMQQVTEVGPDPSADVRGLRRAVLEVFERPEVLWCSAGARRGGTAELSGTSELLLPGETSFEEFLSWPREKRARVNVGDPPTHPVTDENWARPPPTARWGPNKPPRPPPPTAAESLAALGSRVAARARGARSRYRQGALEFFSDDFVPFRGDESDDSDQFATGFE